MFMRFYISNIEKMILKIIRKMDRILTCPLNIKRSIVTLNVLYNCNCTLRAFLQIFHKCIKIHGLMLITNETNSQNEFI